MIYVPCIIENFEREIHYKVKNFSDIFKIKYIDLNGKLHKISKRGAPTSFIDLVITKDNFLIAS